MHQVLWYKLKTAERLSSWTKSSKYPVCGALETLHHSLNACRFHVLIFDSLEKCWAPVTQGGVRYNVRCIPTVLSSSTPLGIMVWVARAAHWSLRNSLLRGGQPSSEAFLTVWTKTIQVVALWEPLQRFSGVFQQFHSSLLQDDHGSLITHQIVYLPNESLLEEHKEKKRRCIARKQELAAEAPRVIKQKEGDGHLLAGSAEYVATHGWIGGWGCCAADGWEKASHLPPH